MDTRAKIITTEQALARIEQGGANLLIVTGYFDPILADHAARIAESARGGAEVIAFVAEPSQPLLPLAARLEIVAALRGVSAVAPAPASLEAKALRFEEQDLKTREAFLDRVRERAALA